MNLTKLAGIKWKNILRAEGNNVIRKPLEGHSF